MAALAGAAEKLPGFSEIMFCRSKQNRPMTGGLDLTSFTGLPVSHASCWIPASSQPPLPLTGLPGSTLR
jgi:hypothetical protein